MAPATYLTATVLLMPIPLPPLPSGDMLPTIFIITYSSVIVTLTPTLTAVCGVVVRTRATRTRREWTGRRRRTLDPRDLRSCRPSLVVPVIMPSSSGVFACVAVFNIITTTRRGGVRFKEEA